MDLRRSAGGDGVGRVEEEVEVGRAWARRRSGQATRGRARRAASPVPAAAPPADRTTPSAHPPSPRSASARRGVGPEPGSCPGHSSISRRTSSRRLIATIARFEGSESIEQMLLFLPSASKRGEVHGQCTIAPVERWLDQLVLEPKSTMSPASRDHRGLGAPIRRGGIERPEL